MSTKHLDDYDVIEKHGEGTFGIVFKAKHEESNEIVAIKKTKVHHKGEGISSEMIREVAILKELNHPNIVSLKDWILEGTLYLVFEFLSTDLKKLIKDIPEGEFMDPNVVKVLQAITFCHCHGLIHRDLKPANLLLDSNGVIKVADFGLARPFTIPVDKIYTPKVMTKEYRAPELLLGARRYTIPIDVWSIGIIMAEMACGYKIFCADSEIGQILEIFRILGTPTEEVWSGVTSLKHFSINFPKWPVKRDLREYEFAKRLGKVGMDLLLKCLEYSPAKRISAKKALNHPFFATLDKESMPAADIPFVTPINR